MKARQHSKAIIPEANASSVLIKQEKKDGKELFKPFKIDLQVLTGEEGLALRCKINDNMFASAASGGIPDFSYWVDVVRSGTYLTDEQIQAYSTDEIMAIAERIVEDLNKKK